MGEMHSCLDPLPLVSLPRAAGLVAAAAWQGNQPGVLRVDAAFGRDPTFGSNGFAGVTWTTAANATPYLSAFAIDALGRSLIAGYVVRRHSRV